MHKESTPLRIDYTSNTKYVRNMDHLNNNIQEYFFNLPFILALFYFGEEEG